MSSSFFFKSNIVPLTKKNHSIIVNSLLLNFLAHNFHLNQTVITLLDLYSMPLSTDSLIFLKYTSFSAQKSSMPGYGIHLANSKWFSLTFKFLLNLASFSFHFSKTDVYLELLVSLNLLFS